MLSLWQRICWWQKIGYLFYVIFVAEIATCLVLFMRIWHGQRPQRICLRLVDFPISFLFQMERDARKWTKVDSGGKCQFYIFAESLNLPFLLIFANSATTLRISQVLWQGLYSRAAMLKMMQESEPDAEGCLISSSGAWISTSLTMGMKPFGAPAHYFEKPSLDGKGLVENLGALNFRYLDDDRWPLSPQLSVGVLMGVSESFFLEKHIKTVSCWDVRWRLPPPAIDLQGHLAGGSFGGSTKVLFTKAK